MNKSTDFFMRTSLLATFSLKVKVWIYSQLWFACQPGGKSQITQYQCPHFQMLWTSTNIQMFNKYLDLHFSYNFYRTKVRSLHCQYHSLTYLNDEAVYSVLLVDLSKGRMEELNRCWSTILKLNFGQDFEVEVYIQGFIIS